MLEIGSLVAGKYKILSKIAQSDMCVVYAALNGQTNKIWAVKEIIKENESIKQRLAAKTELLKELSHPNLPTIIDIVDNDDSFIIIMEYFEGTKLNKVIEEHGAQTQDTVIEWAKQLCDVLDYLHSQHPAIICGDMKPSNIMLKPDGNVTLIDFGTSPEFKERNLADNTCPDTFRYVAPEQFAFKSRTDERTDIYRLGATLYDLLTGYNPNEPSYKIKPIRKINSGISDEVEKIILKSMQLAPYDRYQSAAEMLYALNHCEGACRKKRKTLRQLFRGHAGRKEASTGTVSTAMPHVPDPQRSDFFDSGVLASPCVLENETPDFACRSYCDVPEFSGQNGNVNIAQVCFSAVVPKRFIKGDYAMIEIAIYEELYRSIVDMMVANADTEVKEVVGSVQDINRNTMIRIELSSSDIELSDCEEAQRWSGKYLIFGFTVEVPNDYAKKQIRFTASVYFNDVIATRLKFVASCTSVREQKLELIREDVLTAFISYASQDRAEVATIIQGMKKIRPDLDVFFDVDNLRSGEYWEAALKREIEKRDILFLCWSKFAKESEWVEKEWKYALKNKGIDSIEPVSLVSPSECPPPEELKSKHFNDRALLYKKI